jgi:adenylate cyclase
VNRQGGCGAMSLIHFLPDDQKIEVEEDETILQGAVRAGLALTHFCGGNARCSTCRVVILTGVENCAPRNPAEQAIAEMLRLDPKVRLACQTHVTGNIKLRRLITDSEEVDLNSLFVKGAEPCAVGVEQYSIIMFADVWGFTPFAETLLPYDVIHALNLYFHEAGKVIGRHGGRIDNYMGDGFMALFEADDPAEGGIRAVTAGLELIEAVHGLGPYLQELYGKSFQIRVGLHYGQVVAGKLGSKGNKKMTVIGDAVNFASRIEAANKRAGTQLLVSKDLYDLVKKQVRVGRKAHLSLPGKSGEHTLYEIIGCRDES